MQSAREAVAVNRGLLDSLTPALLAYLFEFLPQAEPVAERVPGSLLTSELLTRLRSERFSGYALTKSPNAGLMLIYRGRLLEAWEQVSGGTGVKACQLLLSSLPYSTLSLYRLPTESLPAVLSLTQGTVRYQGNASTVSNPKLLELLSHEQLNGAVVLENGEVGRAWYFSQGKNLFGHSMPDVYREGHLHIVQAPAKAPKDILEQLKAQ